MLRRLPRCLAALPAFLNQPVAASSRSPPTFPRQPPQPTLAQAPVRTRHSGGGKHHQPMPSSTSAKSVDDLRQQLPQPLLDFFREDDLLAEFERVLTRLQTNCQQRLALRYTPQMFAELPNMYAAVSSQVNAFPSCHHLLHRHQLPQHHVKLGEVAHLVVQSSGSSMQASQGAGQPQLLLVDLAGRPDLVSAARKAVSQLFDSVKGHRGSTQLEAAGQHAFLIPLHTVVTQEGRQEMLNRGIEMLNQAKREMDKAYQVHDKLIQSTGKLKRQFSEDALFRARDYLRLLVKYHHQLGATIWEEKESELKNF